MEGTFQTVCCAVLLVAQVFPTLCDPMDCRPPGSVRGDSPEYWSELPCLPPEDLLNPGIKPRSLALHLDSLPSEPPGRPKNTGAGSLSLLQGNSPTQKSSWGLLHCRQILYQLSHLGSLSDNIQETETLQGKVCILKELKQTEI